MVDLLILHAKIINGTGNPWYYGNVAVKDGRFVAVGSFDPPQAKKVIDAKGAVPGVYRCTHAQRYIAYI